MEVCDERVEIAGRPRADPEARRGRWPIGDGLVVASAEEAATWARWTKPAPASVVDEWLKMETDRDQREGTR